MTFRLSAASLAKLEGVDTNLASVVKRAIQITLVDFSVIEGLRTVEQQRILVAKGASQTMDSKHITGNAVDLMAYVDGRASWELNLYDDIALAMKYAATELKVKIRWGAAWNVPDLTKWNGTMEGAMNYYIDSKRKVNQRPFIDAPHFELA
mgnify:CR=1 FL=1